MAKKKNKGNWGKWMLGEKKKSKGSRKSGDPRWSKEFWGEESNPKKDEDEDVEELEEVTEDHRGHGHDCEKVHPDESHKEWKEGEDEHDKNAASEGPHGESHGKPHKEDEDEEDDDDDDVKEEGKGKPEWLKKKLGEDGDDDDDEDVKEETAIPMFIKNLAEKNYAEANKYLQAAVESKLRSRIATTAKKLGF